MYVDFTTHAKLKFCMCGEILNVRKNTTPGGYLSHCESKNNTMLQSMVRNHNTHGSPPPIEAGWLLSDSRYAMMKGKTMSMKVV
jgi:hypothetical protein